VDREAFVERLRVRLAPTVADPAAPVAAAAPVIASRPAAAPVAAPVGAAPARPVSARAVCTALFVERLRELGVEVATVASEQAARAGLERLAAERGWRDVACAPGLRWEAAGVRWTDEAREASFGLCRADWAVAETASVVVCASAEVRRGYSLVPPAVGFFVSEWCILATVGDVLRELPTDGLALPSCVSFISGPSSTSDLAAVRVVGVHGPGEVNVWVIADGAVGHCDARQETPDR
jgi:L-lactate dehydrogenase complex protein LldG